MINLQSFCATDIDDGNPLSSPFSDNTHSYACNGHMIIRVKRVDAVTLTVPREINIEKIFSSFNLTTDLRNDFPKYPDPEKRKCDDCKGTTFSRACYECEDGEGIVHFENIFNSYELECKTCRGNGYVSGGKKHCSFCGGAGEVYVNEYDFVDFGEKGVSIKLLDKIKNLPGVRVGEMNINHMVPFFFSGGDGVLMGMYK